MKADATKELERVKHRAGELAESIRSNLGELKTLGVPTGAEKWLVYIENCAWHLEMLATDSGAESEP